MGLYGVYTIDGEGFSQLFDLVGASFTYHRCRSLRRESVTHQALVGLRPTKQAGILPTLQEKTYEQAAAPSSAFNRFGTQISPHAELAQPEQDIEKLTRSRDCHSCCMAWYWRLPRHTAGGRLIIALLCEAEGI